MAGWLAGVNRSPALLIGLRYILTRKDHRFVSFTSLISMAGLTLGVFAVIVVLSVFNGSQGLMRERTLITVPHGDIYSRDGFPDWQAAAATLASQEEIDGVAPYLSLEAMMSHQGYHQVALIKGIDPALEVGVSPIEHSMRQGSLHDLQAGRRSIILGQALAGYLRLSAGDPVNLIVPGAGNDPRNLKLSMHRFTVSGIFDVQFSIGSDLALIHLEDGLELLGLAAPAEQVRLRLRVNDLDAAADIVQDGLALLNAVHPGPNYAGVDWSASEASLFNALKLEKVMTWFMLMMIVAVGAFNIISTLVMVVSEKGADIAILRTMGAGEKTIMGIFMVQGTVVGILGTLLGAVAGALVAINFGSVAFLLESTIIPGDLYVISTLPAQLQLGDLWLTCGAALLISFLATLYPAWKASRILPAEVLRYE